MSLQDMKPVQALLCLLQYYFRAQTESPIWHLVGLALRLCVKLRYHRKLANSPDSRSLDPWELRKRFFWCAYCFDRSLAIWSKLPFGISGFDIDAEATGTKPHGEEMITTMTEAQEATSGPTPESLQMETMAMQYDSILGGQSSVVFDEDFPLEMPLDISPLYAPDVEVPGLWTEPWLRLSSSEYT